jgi:hypothetical protein
MTGANHFEMMPHTCPAVVCLSLSLLLTPMSTIAVTNVSLSAVSELKIHQTVRIQKRQVSVRSDIECSSVCAAFDCVAAKFVEKSSLCLILHFADDNSNGTTIEDNRWRSEEGELLLVDEQIERRVMELGVGSWYEPEQLRISDSSIAMELVSWGIVIWKVTFEGEKELIL